MESSLLGAFRSLCHYRFRKAPARQAAGGDRLGSPSGEELEGESPRGGDMKPAGVNAPYHFGNMFEKNVVLKSHSKTVMEKSGS